MLTLSVAVPGKEALSLAQEKELATKNKNNIFREQNDGCCSHPLNQFAQECTNDATTVFPRFSLLLLPRHQDILLWCIICAARICTFRSALANWVWFFFFFNILLRLSFTWAWWFLTTDVRPSLFKEAFLVLLLPEMHSRTPARSYLHLVDLLPWKGFSFYSESGYLSCSFDDGLCGWIRDDGDVHWETTPDPSGNCCFRLIRRRKSCMTDVAQMQRHTHTHRGALLLNYRSWWNDFRGSSLSRRQIRALLYKAMQMRSGLHNLSAIPLAPIKGEHDTVFLGVRLRRKRDELVEEIRRR